MNKERTEVGDMRINRNTKKPEVCVEVSYHANGWVESEWKDYEKNLLKTRLGMSPESHQLYSLQHFIDVLNANQPIKQKDSIKIRYAYITSLTNVKEDPFYREYLAFRTLILNDLETSHDTLEDLLTEDTTTLIRILGRDLYTGRVDMDGKEIYGRDVIRRYTEGGSYIEETVNPLTGFYEQESEKYCKVVGTIYNTKKWTYTHENKRNRK